MSKIAYGSTAETHQIDENGSDLTVVEKFNNHSLGVRLKRYKIREKVYDKRGEMSEFIKFTELLAEKQEQGILVMSDKDPTMLPAFVVEYPIKVRADSDGAWFVQKCWTEVVQ